MNGHIIKVNCEMNPPAAMSTLCADECAVIVPKIGGADEYAKHERNALVADTSCEADCYEALAQLVRDEELWNRLWAAGQETAASYSIEDAALSELMLMLAIRQQRVQKGQGR